LVAQNANTLNLTLNRISVIHTRDSRWGAGEDDIAREKGDVLGYIGNYGFYVVDHVIGVGVLTRFITNPRIQALILWVKVGLDPWA
jgi:hypothetical protein